MLTAADIRKRLESARAKLDDTLDIVDYVAGSIERFKADVTAKLRKRLDK